jgi:tryptophan synthase beta chain
VLHGALSMLLQDAKGQVINAHSISAGLDYPGVGPEHSWLKQSGRATYVPVGDDEALRGFVLLSRSRASSRRSRRRTAVAWIAASAGAGPPDEPVLLCVSGRGDKDVAQVSAMGELPDVGRCRSSRRDGCPGPDRDRVGDRPPLHRPCAPPVDARLCAT